MSAASGSSPACFVRVAGDISNAAHLSSVALGARGHSTAKVKHIIAHAVDETGNWPVGGLFRVIASIHPALPRQYSMACRTGSLARGGCMVSQTSTISDDQPVVALMCCMKRQEQAGRSTRNRIICPELLLKCLQHFRRQFLPVGLQCWVHTPQWESGTSGQDLNLSQVLTKELVLNGICVAQHRFPRAGGRKRQQPGGEAPTEHESTDYAALFASASAAACQASRGVGRAQLALKRPWTGVQRRPAPEGAVPNDAPSSLQMGFEADTAAARCKQETSKAAAEARQPGRHCTWGNRAAEGCLPPVQAGGGGVILKAAGTAPPPVATGVPSHNAALASKDDTGEGLGTARAAAIAEARKKQRCSHRGEVQWWAAEVCIRGLPGPVQQWEEELQHTLCTAEAGGAVACSRLAYLRQRAATGPADKLLFEFLRHTMGLHGL